MTKKLTKLQIRIEHPPISIFRMEQGKKDVDMSYVYESAFEDISHYFFMVPDGTYLVTQGDKPCVYTVANGKVTHTEKVTKAPIGNTVEELTSPYDKAKVTYSEPEETVADILHVHDRDKKKRK